MLRRVSVTALAIAFAATLAACGSDDGTTEGGQPRVVASTNVWGSVASAIAGDDATVTSVIKDPAADPHSYEASPADAAEISKADLVVLNGGGYDEFAEDSAKGRTTVDAFELNGTHGNEHVWYDIPTVDKVARKIADELSGIDADHAAEYKQRADDFSGKLAAISAVTTKIKADHPNSPVAQTEPIAQYLIDAAGAQNLTPEDFQDAIEEGNDPSPAAIAATRDLLTAKKVRALVYNIQTEDKVTEDIKKTAESNGIKIVEVTETLPDGLDYIQWQTANAQALASALN